MTLTVTEIMEEDLDMGLDFAYAVPCEADSPPATCGGNNPAEYRLLTCCGMTRLYCGPCKDYKMRLRVVICTACWTEYSPGSTAYFYVEAL